ncbi:MAG TPA: Xaa-Pro dipeptidase [Kofleriaceae bacterium]|nr:Xaa-Pro dipeptidase [Kofleriaceae bacterium]
MSPDPAALALAYAQHVDQIVRAYAAATEAHGFGALAIHAGAPALVNRFDDRHHGLSPTPSFTHVAPIGEPDAWIVIRPGARPRLIRPVVEDFWEAPPPAPPDFVLAAFDVVHANVEQIASLIPQNKTAIVSRDPIDREHLNPPALIEALDAARTRKTSYERLCLAEATRRAVIGHRAAAARFAADANASELQLHLHYLDASGQADGDTPYQGIVALGRHAATLHHVSYDREPGRRDESLLVDAGASFLGYGADITRTYARGDTGLFHDLLARMDDLQQEICRRIKPGLAYETLHDEAHHLLAAVLVDLDIAGGPRGSTASLVDRGVTRALFPHGLGHSLGVCVHDVGMKRVPPRPDNPFLRNTSTIEVGQVFTIEPGCYVIDALLAPLRADDRADLIDWDAIEAIRPFGGIRVEDDVAVVDGGLTNFTRDAFAA